jgi:hypothetical protein
MAKEPGLLVVNNVHCCGTTCGSLYMLHSLWVTRCLEAGCPSHSARAAVGRFVGAVKHQVAMERRRVSNDIRWGTGLPFYWLRGRDPRIQPAAFKARWCQRGVIASSQFRPPSASHPFGEYVFCLSALSWSLGGGSREVVV